LSLTQLKLRENRLLPLDNNSRRAGVKGARGKSSWQDSESNRIHCQVRRTTTNCLGLSRDQGANAGASQR